MPNPSNRRKFLGTAAAAFTVLPRRLLARSGEVPPSDKITLAYIGTGTQGLRELLPLLAAPEIRVISVCDPSKHALGYRDWARDSLLREIRRALNQSDWPRRHRGHHPRRPRCRTEHRCLPTTNCRGPRAPLWWP